MSERFQAELDDIVKVVEGLPERYRDKAFELLLSEALGHTRGKKELDRAAKTDGTPDRSTLPTLPGKVRAFMQRFDFTEDDLKKLVLIEDGEVHFIREPAEAVKAVGQIRWALLLALKSAVLGQDFTVDPEDVRSVCIAKDMYDRGNFASTFKRYKDLFTKLPEPQGDPVGLSGKGQTELGNVVKALIA